tara:strand:- start:179 stop:595 length:417 start_codon:yes stop_codon:yes gene_type:complete
MEHPKKSEKDLVKNLVSETQYESSEAKISKPKKVSKAALAKKAKEIIERQQARKNREPGSLVGGDTDSYHYSWIPNHEPQHTTLMVKMIDLGYEKEPDLSIHFSGILGGTVLRIPAEVKEYMRAERAKKHGIKHKKGR